MTPTYTLYIIHYTFIHTEPINDHQPWPGQSIMSHIEYKIGPSGL